jgi:hypothetical protein
MKRPTEADILDWLISAACCALLLSVALGIPASVWGS